MAWVQKLYYLIQISLLLYIVEWRILVVESKLLSCGNKAMAHILIVRDVKEFLRKKVF
jgi:hypothetical protein